VPGDASRYNDDDELSAYVCEYFGKFLTPHVHQSKTQAPQNETIAVSMRSSRLRRVSRRDSRRNSHGGY
jgi:hypothetical protein